MCFIYTINRALAVKFVLIDFIKKKNSDFIYDELKRKSKLQKKFKNHNSWFIFL